MKIFVTGISGLLGLNIAVQTRERFQVSGSYYSHPIALDGTQALKVDITSSSALEEALCNIRPDVIVHTAGLTNVEECEVKPELAYRLNVEATQHVARIANVLGARLAYISTDHLFDGTRSWRKETDAPTPLNVYARTKWQAERAVLQACPDALIIRTNFFGWGTPVRTSFSDWILQALAEQRELTMFSDVFFTPILMNDLVDMMTGLLARGVKGIFNVAGGERLSKYAFALQIAGVFSYPKDHIRAISIDDVALTARRPKDMSLNSEKAEGCLQVRMPTVAESLQRLQSLSKRDWPQVLEQAFQNGSSFSNGNRQEFKKG